MGRIFLMWVKESFVIRISGSSSNLRLAESQISGWVSEIAANTFSGSEAVPVCPVEEMLLNLRTTESRICGLLLLGFSGSGAAELAIQDICQGSHDGIVFAAVLEEGAIGLLGFHIAGLGGLAEGLGEDALHEDLRI